jgi:uncharacterized protein (TIGR03085 family)
MGYARDERLELCAALDAAGPREPTLCAGWTTLDLAAHLVLREHRPDAAAGIPGGPLASYTRSVQRKIAAKTPFTRLVQMVREGPPLLSPMRIPGADERANTVEFFVHHEDVRRASPGWEPRQLDPGLSAALWRSLRMSRFVLRKVPVGIELVRDDEPGPVPGGSGEAAAPVRLTVRARTPVVTVTGPPAELTLWALGRGTAAQVRLDGSEPALAALRSAAWRI